MSAILWAVALAVLLDLLLGEPPVALHPVVWIGRYLGFARSKWRGRTPRAQLLEGTLWWSLGAGLVTLAAWVASELVARLPTLLEVIALALMLKPLIALRSLWTAVRAVHRPLKAAQLSEARRMLAWHLVSRDTSHLREDEVAGAAIESLFENLSDSIIAPLLCFLVGGLPLAALYRFANTADAMWGYRTPALEYAGKFAARADDALNLVPSRVTGACIALASLETSAWLAMLRDGLRTASPNAGVPMSAGAGALGVRLEKRGVYALNAAHRAPETDDIGRALRLASAALTVFLLGVIVYGLVR